MLAIVLLKERLVCRMISLIVAHDKNFLIGKDGWMPWNLKEDLKHFKNTTLNSTVVMGRKTYEGLKKPLKDRKTIVVTSDKNYHIAHENVFVINDLLKYLNSVPKEEKVYIAGGAKIYNQCFAYCDELIITKVFGDYEGDTYIDDYTKLGFELQNTIHHDGFDICYYLKKKGN